MSERRILFLDDDPRRTSLFTEWLGRVRLDAVTVETADDCIRALADERFELVLLDHDLGGETYCDSSREDCGMEVVRWLARVAAEEGARDHGHFIVHSMNAVAAAAMYFDLQGLGYGVTQAPFGSREFYATAASVLGVVPPQQRGRPEPKSFGERVRDYLESIKRGNR